MKQILFPTVDDLRAEHVLVQAWKKTATYLRQHNWYADTLELDYQSLRLPDFIRDLQERLKSPASWESAPLAIVPAPKSQHWKLEKDGNGEDVNPPGNGARRPARKSNFLSVLSANTSNVDIRHPYTMGQSGFSEHGAYWKWAPCVNDLRNDLQ